jgi:hypothetical protein
MRSAEAFVLASLLLAGGAVMSLAAIAWVKHDAGGSNTAYAGWRLVVRLASLVACVLYWQLLADTRGFSRGSTRWALDLPAGMWLASLLFAYSAGWWFPWSQRRRRRSASRRCDAQKEFAGSERAASLATWSGAVLVVLAVFGWIIVSERTTVFRLRAFLPVMSSVAALGLGVTLALCEAMLPPASRGAATQPRSATRIEDRLPPLSAPAAGTLAPEVVGSENSANDALPMTPRRIVEN